MKHDDSLAHPHQSEHKAKLILERHERKRPVASDALKHVEPAHSTDASASDAEAVLVHGDTISRPSFKALLRLANIREGIDILDSDFWGDGTESATKKGLHIGGSQDERSSSVTSSVGSPYDDPFDAKYDDLYTGWSSSHDFDPRWDYSDELRPQWQEHPLTQLAQEHYQKLTNGGGRVFAADLEPHGAVAMHMFGTGGDEPAMLFDPMQHERHTQSPEEAQQQAIRSVEHEYRHAQQEQETGEPNWDEDDAEGWTSRVKLGSPYDRWTGWNGISDPYVYHVAPASERERIQAHGLFPQRPQDNPTWQGDSVEEQVPGVYVSQSPEEAREWNPTGDVWRIHKNDIRDRQLDPMGEGYYIPHQVPAELHEPGDEHIWDFYGPERKWGKVGSPYEAGLTRNQYLRQMAELEAQMGPDKSKLVHQFDNGWSIASPKTQRDVKRIGTLMGHCWKSGFSGRGTPHVLRDPDQIPRIAFNVGPAHMEGGGYLPHGATDPFQPVIVNGGTNAPAGHDNSRPKPEHWNMLREWGNTFDPPLQMSHYTEGQYPQFGGQYELGDIGPNPFWDEAIQSWIPKGSHAKLGALAEPLEPHLDLYHGTTNKALELAQQRGGLHAWHPRDVAQQVAEHYALDPDELYNHPYFEFSRSGRDDNKIYMATDPTTAQDYANTRSEQLTDALHTAHRMLYPQMYNNASAEGFSGVSQREHRDALNASRQQFEQNYHAQNDLHPQVIKLRVPYSAIDQRDEIAKAQQWGYEPSGTYTTNGPVPLDWMTPHTAKVAAYDEDQIEYDPRAELHKGTMLPNGRMLLWPTRWTGHDFEPSHQAMCPAIGKDFVVNGNTVYHSPRDDLNPDENEHAQYVSSPLSPEERQRIYQATGARRFESRTAALDKSPFTYPDNMQMHVEYPTGWEHPYRGWQEETFDRAVMPHYRTPFWIGQHGEDPNNHRIFLGHPGSYHDVTAIPKDYRIIASGAVKPAGYGEIGPGGGQEYPHAEMQLFNFFTPRPKGVPEFDEYADYEGEDDPEVTRALAVENDYQRQVFNKAHEALRGEFPELGWKTSKTAAEPWDNMPIDPWTWQRGVQYEPERYPIHKGTVDEQGDVHVWPVNVAGFPHHSEIGIKPYGEDDLADFIIDGDRLYSIFHPTPYPERYRARVFNAIRPKIQFAKTADVAKTAFTVNDLRDQQYMSDYWGGDTGFNSRHPLLYDHDTDTLHIGPANTTHPQVMGHEGFDSDADLAFGWIGPNYEKLINDAVYNRDKPNEVGWYVAPSLPRPPAAVHQFATQLANENLQQFSGKYHNHSVTASEYDHEDSLIGTATSLVDMGTPIQEAANWLTQSLTQSGRPEPESQAISDEVFQKRGKVATVIREWPYPDEQTPYSSMMPRKPMFYDPDTDEVHVGQWGMQHSQLAQSLPPETSERINMVGGWLGHDAQMRGYDTPDTLTPYGGWYHGGDVPQPVHSTINDWWTGGSQQGSPRHIGKTSWWKWVNPDRKPSPVELMHGPTDETHPLAGGPDWTWVDEREASYEDWENEGYTIPSTMYHVAPAEHRQSIQQHGIDRNRGASQWNDDSFIPRANYLWHHPEDAEEYVHTVGRGRLHDIWEVNMEGLNHELDPQSGAASMTYDPIPADRVQHYDEVQPQDWEDRYSSRREASETMNWEPGNWGKGVIIGDEPHTWNTAMGGVDFMGSPHHAGYLKQHGIDVWNYNDWQRFSDPIVIGPEGWYTTNDTTPGSQLTKTPERFAQIGGGLKYVDDEDKWRRRVGKNSEKWQLAATDVRRDEYGHPTVEPWREGTWGKGMLVDGEPHVWQTENPGGSPHHLQYARLQGLSDTDFDLATDLIQIAPDGSYAVDPDGPNISQPERFAQMVPGLRYMRDVNRWNMRAFSGTDPDFYHIAPTTERARIQQHGLQPSKPMYNERWHDYSEGSPSEAKGDPVPPSWLKNQPEGVYAQDDPARARDIWTEDMYGNRAHDMWDTWRIPEAQIQDYELDPWTNQLVIRHPVHPELYEGGPEVYGEWPKRSKTAGLDQYAEMVPIDAIDHLREYDRTPGGAPGVSAKPEYWERLKNHIAQNGFENPVVLDYNPWQGTGYVSEGNHRIGVAKELGMTHVPMFVYRTTSEHPRMRPMHEPETYVMNDKYGFSQFPQYAKPSEIGLPVAGPYQPAEQTWYDMMRAERDSKVAVETWTPDAAECQVCDGEGEIPLDPDGFEVEKCETCNGTGIWSHPGQGDVFHAAPTTERNRILQHGLHPSNPFYEWETPEAWEDKYGEGFRPPIGVYGYPNHNDALVQQDELTYYRKTPHDIWRIPNVEYQGDPDNEGAVYVPHHVMNPEFHAGPESDVQTYKDPNHPRIADPERYGSRTDHAVWWQPGDWGRGFIQRSNGRVHSWPEGDASHQQAAWSKNIPWEDVRTTSFLIRPDGMSMFPYLPKEQAHIEPDLHAAIQEADPRLKGSTDTMVVPRPSAVEFRAAPAP